MQLATGIALVATVAVLIMGIVVLSRQATLTQYVLELRINLAKETELRLELAHELKVQRLELTSEFEAHTLDLANELDAQRIDLAGELEAQRLELTNKLKAQHSNLTTQLVALADELETQSLTLTNKLEAQHSNLTDGLESLTDELNVQSNLTAELQSVTTNTPLVLTEWLGESNSDTVIPKFLTHNRKTGEGSLTGQARQSLQYLPAHQVGDQVWAFWMLRIEIWPPTNAGQTHPSRLLRYILEQGTGPNIDRGAPDFFPDSAWWRCRPILTLNGTADSYIYISKTGTSVSSSDPNNFHKTKFNGTAALFRYGTDTTVAIGHSYAQEVAASFGVTLSTQSFSVALDIDFTMEGVFGTLSLDHREDTSYEILNHFSC